MLGKFEFVKVELPPVSPKSTQEAWNAIKPTTLMRVNPLVHCLSMDGDLKKYKGGEYFVACASPAGTASLSADSCNIGTHLQPDRPKIQIDEPAYFVKVRPSSAATKPKILSGVFLIETDIPSSILQGGGGNLLTSFELPPPLWKFMIEMYPGYHEMLDFVRQAHPVPFVETGPQVEDVSDNESVLGTGGLGLDSGGGEDQFPTSAERGQEVLFNLPKSKTGPREVKRQSRLAGQDFFSSDNPQIGGQTQSPWAGDGSVASSGFKSLGIQSQADETYWSNFFMKMMRKVESHRADFKAKWHALNTGLDEDFGMITQKMERISAMTEEAAAEAERAHERLNGLDLERMPKWQRDNRHGTITPPPKFNCSALTRDEQAELVEQITANLDLPSISRSVGRELRLQSIREDVQDHGNRISCLEGEFTHGAIQQIQEDLRQWEARRDVSSVERAGYIFNGPEDVSAIVQSISKKDKLFTKCLDMYGFLTLAQDPYVTFESGMRVHADAIKANFESVVESRIKLSFEIPYPEIIIKCTETATTAARGGAKWAPMFASAEVFEDNFRDGAHRRVINGIERAYELVQKNLDRTFPISQRGAETADSRKIHTIFSDQNRRAYRQTIQFIECLLPFCRTIESGSLTKEEAWDRVFVFTMELLSALQECRVLASTDSADEAGMIWGCFKATDLAEEFRKQKYVEHSKALGILALTSIEREGKTMQMLEERMKKLIENAKSDKLNKLETRVQTMENKMKNIMTKNPDLK
jgi:hypothetical protein